MVALDFPLCHFEVRMTAMSSQDSIGMDADQLEFRFRSASDKVDVACSQVTVPSRWLVLSRVSGPTLIQNARWCRERQARVEGPDLTMQMSQLAGIHAHWTAATEAAGIQDTGPRIGAVAVESHPSNVHLTCEAPLLKALMVLVPKEAIALQYHDIAAQELALTLLSCMEDMQHHARSLCSSTGQDGRGSVQGAGDPRRRSCRIPGDVRQAPPGCALASTQRTASQVR